MLRNTQIECGDSEVVMPVDGDGSIDMDFDASDEENIGIGLPEEVEDAEGVVTDNGTVVYNPEKEDMAVEVQVLEKEEDGVAFDAVKQMITIESADAPHEYGFEYELGDGYGLVRSEEYYEEESVNPYPGWVFVVNENSRILTEEEVEGIDECGLDEIEEEELPGMAEIVMFIEPAWAKDAEGNDVNTYYAIEGNVLKQYVDFDENSLFPIVADPTSDKPDAHWVKGKKHTKTFAALKNDIHMALSDMGIYNLANNYQKHQKALDNAKTKKEKEEAEKLIKKDKKLFGKAMKKVIKEEAKRKIATVYFTGFSLVATIYKLGKNIAMYSKGFDYYKVKINYGL